MTSTLIGSAQGRRNTTEKPDRSRSPSGRQNIRSFDDVKRKRSLSTDLVLIKHHLKPFFGSMLFTGITRESLCRYVDRRTTQTIIRCGKASKKKWRPRYDLERALFASQDVTHRKP